MRYARSLTTFIVTAVALAGVGTVHAQNNAINQSVNPNAQPNPVGTNGGISRNSFQAGKSVADVNKIIQPTPLNAVERDNALAGIDKHVAEEVEILKGKLKTLLPDELSILSKTVGWTPEKQNALLVAVRAGDPAAVYEAWTQGNPQDTAGAEIVARQTDVRRTFSRLEQKMKSNASISQEVADLDTSLSKITNATPGASEVVATLATLKTWSEVRKMVDAVVPDAGATAKLPTGKVPLIYDSSLPVGKAIVLGHDAVMIGNQGKGPITIRQGIAAEALGLPIVTGKPVADAEGKEITNGVLLINPPTSNGTITYNVNGIRYVAQAGMTQHLPATTDEWTVDYDKGGNFGPAGYTVTAGTYYFTPTDMGWQLYKDRFDVVLDNSQSNQEFNYLLNGEKMVVPANGTKQISSIYPMVIHYDRGNGSELVAKVLSFSGNVQIGVNVADNRWDVFPTNNNQRTVSNLKLFDR